MITRQNLNYLQSLTKVPALSILLPTHRSFPENKQDPIRVKNLVDSAIARLNAEFSARDLEPLVQRLETLVSSIDYPHTLDGLALYVSHDIAQLYYLPFAIPERVVIDQTFATRDLVYGLHREQRYWVLLLSQASTRLLVGTGETLEEVQDGGFPLPMTGPGATMALPHEADSSYVDDRLRRFYQQVDSALMEFTKEDALPLIVGGVDRQVSFFQEVSQQATAIAGTLSGNFDKATISELTEPVLAIMKTVRETQRASAMQDLDTAIGAQKLVSSIPEVWRLAQDGRGKTLLVEKNYHVPAVLSATGNLELVEQVGGTDVMDDAVDEVIEAVLGKGGDVVFVEDGALSAHQQIALILRY